MGRAARIDGVLATTVGSVGSGTAGSGNPKSSVCTSRASAFGTAEAGRAGGNEDFGALGSGGEPILVHSCTMRSRVSGRRRESWSHGGPGSRKRTRARQRRCIGVGSQHDTGSRGRRRRIGRGPVAKVRQAVVSRVLGEERRGRLRARFGRRRGALREVASGWVEAA